MGADAKLLTETEEVESHSLFEKILSKEAIEGEADTDSELRYLAQIREIRDNSPELFERIKHLPKKSRSALRKDISGGVPPFVLTYYRKGRLEKFCLTSQLDCIELDFMQSAKMLECSAETEKAQIGRDFYNLKDRNDALFEELVEHPLFVEEAKRGANSNAAFIVKVLKSRIISEFKGFTEEDEEYISDVIQSLEDGAVPKNTVLKLKK